MNNDSKLITATVPVDPYKKSIRATSWAPYWVRGIVAIVVGVAMYYGILHTLDVHLEWYSGIAGFNASWLVAMGILPVITGIAIGVIYGFGGKYLAHFPPAFYMLYAYQTTYSVPEGSHLLPWGLWIVFVILQMEFCAVGGFIGELLIRKRYSWDDPDFRAADSEALPDDDGIDSKANL
ncbi:MAG: hypothetical protein R8L58_04735 [Mariprofundaceae bacterium]